MEIFKSGKSEDNLFYEFGIPEGTMCGCMKEEGKLCSFVDSIEDEWGLQRKEPAFDVVECFYKWFLQKCTEGMV